MCNSNDLYFQSPFEFFLIFLGSWYLCYFLPLYIKIQSLALSKCWYVWNKSCSSCLWRYWFEFGSIEKWSWKYGSSWIFQYVNPTFPWNQLLKLHLYVKSAFSRTWIDLRTMWSSHHMNLMDLLSKSIGVLERHIYLTFQSTDHNSFSVTFICIEIQILLRMYTDSKDWYKR